MTRKPTWQWNIATFNRRYISKLLFFHCHVSFREQPKSRKNKMRTEIIWTKSSSTRCVSSPSFVFPPNDVSGTSLTPINVGGRDMEPTTSIMTTTYPKVNSLEASTTWIPGTLNKPFSNGWMEMVIFQPISLCKDLVNIIHLKQPFFTWMFQVSGTQNVFSLGKSGGLPATRNTYEAYEVHFQLPGFAPLPGCIFATIPWCSCQELFEKKVFQKYLLNVPFKELFLSFFWFPKMKVFHVSNF